MTRVLFNCDCDPDTIRQANAADIAVKPGPEGAGDKVRICCPACYRIVTRNAASVVAIELVMAGAHVQAGDEIAPPDVLAFMHDVQNCDLLAPIAGATERPRGQ